MLKKIVLTVLFIALAAGAAYSWNKVDFNRKTAMFFQVVFGDETSMGGHGGRPPMGDNRGGDMSQQEPPRMGEGGDRGAAPPDFGQRGNAEGRPPGNGGPGGHGGPGGYVSLGKVAKYTVIMAFFVMLTRMVDRWSQRRRSRLRHQPA